MNKELRKNDVATHIKNGKLYLEYPLPIANYEPNN